MLVGHAKTQVLINGMNDSPLVSAGLTYSLHGYSPVLSCDVFYCDRVALSSNAKSHNHFAFPLPNAQILSPCHAVLLGDGERVVLTSKDCLSYPLQSLFFCYDVKSTFCDCLPDFLVPMKMLSCVDSC